MTTRSNLNYSVDAESIQRSLLEALQNSASAPLTTPVQSAPSSTGTAPVILPTTSLALSTTLEQLFKLLAEFSKSAYVLWHPKFAIYQAQGGTRTLAQCMEPTVQTAFRRSFKLDRISFFAMTSDNLHILIKSFFQLNIVENYCSLLIPMETTAYFNERACDLYISHIFNLLEEYPSIFDVSDGGGGIDQKFFTTSYVNGLFPIQLRSAVLAKVPKNIDDAVTYLRAQYPRFKTFNEIYKTMNPTISTTSLEGKVADVAISVSSEKSFGSKCPNCNLSHGSYRNCKLSCTLCPQKPTHRFFTKNICNNWLSYKAKKVKAGTWIEHKSANNATFPTAAPAPLQSDVHAELASLSKKFETISTLLQVRRKRILFDSGCNTTIIASPDHSDDNILYRDYEESITTANGQQIPIIGQGSILNMPADFVPSFVDSLVSISQITKSRNSCVIFLKDSALNICLNDSIISLLNKINSVAVDNNLILSTASLTRDNLYAMDNPVIQNKFIPLIANATYYQTAQFDTVADVVRYFHETWSHCSLDSMLHI